MFLLKDPEFSRNFTEYLWREFIFGGCLIGDWWKLESEILIKFLEFSFALLKLKFSNYYVWMGYSKQVSWSKLSSKETLKLLIFGSALLKYIDFG